MLQTIMHVEDNADIRKIAAMSLELIGGFTVVQYETGNDAVKLAHDVRPDIILLDLMMPGMSGEETFRQLRKVAGYEALPIVFVTARAATSDYEKLRALGAAEVIVKPFDPMMLPGQVTEIWEQHQP